MCIRDSGCPIPSPISTGSTAKQPISSSRWGSVQPRGYSIWARTVRGRKMLAMKTGFDEKRLLCWANVADRMRIKGIRKEYAELLQAAGVDTVKDLKYRNPANLANAMAEANKKRKMVRLLPSEKVVGNWIENAKKLQLKISYK